jgi:hypothetical protein
MAQIRDVQSVDVFCVCVSNRRNRLYRISASMNPTNPVEAKACGACKHFKGELTFEKAECHHPELRHGMTYQNFETGEQTHIEWATVGRYHSCKKWELRPLWCAWCGRMGDHQSGWCPELSEFKYPSK